MRAWVPTTWSWWWAPPVVWAVCGSGGQGHGCQVVVGIDVNAEKLARMRDFGADATINPREFPGKGLKERFKAIAKAGVSANTG